MVGKAKQWAARLTGLSTPVFGVSWQPSTAERDVASELLLRLEDRRVLYSPSEAEIPHHCVRSIVEVRYILSDNLVNEWQWKPCRALAGDGRGLPQIFRSRLFERRSGL